MLRLFLAVMLPQEALQACAAEWARLSRELGPLAHGVRFAREQGLHFTLKFLGETPDEQVPALGEALERAVRGEPPFAVALAGLEAFPSLTRPRVLFLPATEGAEALQRLAAGLERELAPLGFAPESRPFHAHVTLARFKDPRQAARLGGRLPEIEGHAICSFRVERVALMQSELHPEGSRYWERFGCSLTH